MKKFIAIVMSVIMTGCFLKWQDASWDEELTDKRAFSVNANKYEDEFGKFSYINDVPADSMEAREYYVRDILSSYGITIAEVRLETGSVISLQCEKYVSREDLENIEYDYGEESEYPECLMQVYFEYDYDNHTALLDAYCDEVGYYEQLSFVPDFDLNNCYYDEDEGYCGYYDGNVHIENITTGEEGYYNVYEIDDMTEDEIEVYFFGTAICGIALWKIVTGIVIACVAVSMVAYPTYYVNTIESFCDLVGRAGECIIEKVKYEVVSLTNEIINELYRRRQYGINNYYLALPIVDNNDYFKGSEQGQMYISAYPLNYAKAKMMLRYGYSIYSFEANDVYRAMRYAWFNGYVLEEACNSGFAAGYYSHYHAYTNDGVRRNGWIDGKERHIHGFYGYAW